MSVTVKIEGLRELETALKELPKATGKGVLRRVLTRRAQPIAEDYRSRVRVDTGALRDSIAVSTKLSRRQKAAHKSMEGKASVEVFVGAGALTQAITEEFGTDKEAAHPGLRPAWDAGKMALIDGIGKDLWAEIKKTADRRAKRLAKAAAKAAL